MTNSNLVARQIVDKNGKQTTVHVSMGKLTGTEGTSQKSVFASKIPPKVSAPVGFYNYSIPVSRVMRNEYLPRKRNPRDVYYEDHVIVDVPSLTEDDAPVDFIANGEKVRSFDGTLYRQYKDGLGKVIEAEDFFAGTPTHGYSRGEGDRPDYAEIYRENADEYVVVDGEVWRKSNEPMYVIERGHYIDRDTMEIKVSFDTNRTRNEDVFSALERGAAVERARGLLEGIPETTRGYGGGAPTTYYYDSAKNSIENLETIEVADSSLVGSTYTFPARLSYPDFSSYEEGDYDGGTKDDSKVAARMQSAMTAYRTALDSIPNAIITEPSGARKINWDLVPEGLKYNYNQTVEWANKNGYIA